MLIQLNIKLHHSRVSVNHGQYNLIFCMNNILPTLVYLHVKHTYIPYYIVCIYSIRSFPSMIKNIVVISKYYIQVLSDNDSKTLYEHNIQTPSDNDSKHYLTMILKYFLTMILKHHLTIIL